MCCFDGMKILLPAPEDMGREEIKEAWQIEMSKSDQVWDFILPEMILFEMNGKEKMFKK